MQRVKLKTTILILLFVFSFYQSFAQITNPLRFTYQDYDSSYTKSSVLGLPNGNLLFFWIEGENLFQSRSTDEGLSWSDPAYITLFMGSQTDNISSVILDSSKIALVYRDNLPNLYSIIFSYDNGVNWTSPISLPVGITPFQRMLATSVNISRIYNNDIYITYGKNSVNWGIYFIKSTDNGYTWTAQQTISGQSSTKNGLIYSFDNQTLMLIYENIQNENSDIYSMLSTDGGLVWSSPTPLINSELNEKRPRILKDNTDTLWLFYELEKETRFTGFYQLDIVYSKSFDNGNTWTVPESFTQYRGLDFNCEITLLNNKPFVSFASSRNFQTNREKFQLYYGIASETIDNNAPPFIYYFEHIPQIPEPLQPFAIRCYVDDEVGINSVKLVTQKNGNKIDTLGMFDDGLNGDSLVNDGIYGIILDDLNKGDSRTYSFIVEDSDLNIVHLARGFVYIPLEFERQMYTLDVNKLKLPINNEGGIADVYDTSGHGTLGVFEESSFLFSAGFFLSGYTNNNLWANGVASSSLVDDYLPGKVGIPPNDPKNNIYIIKSTDLDFGQSWQDWKYAVMQGADFYDGNDDGIYNPVDLNGNGTWDSYEDRPDFLGDVTAWCVYNDGVPSSQRRFYNVEPQGIEIQQTAFAIGNNITGYIQNIIFFRYRIINKGTVASELDSLIFGVYTDPDIGINVQGDFAGVDTVLNSAFAYKKDSDPGYGTNPPAFLTSLLQGPMAYIPGETFIDNNSNGIYDPGIDTPLDTAYHFNGFYIGRSSFPGAKNLSSTSFVHFLNGYSDPNLNDPATRFQLRNFQKGLNSAGAIPDPCNWDPGNVFGVNCNEVNPLFWYSGDPVINYGWINTLNWDQRMMLSTGTFQLKENEPVDIWVAYLVGRGSDPLNSVNIGKDVAQYAIDYYNSNFTVLILDADEPENLVRSFTLFQNYPNPFNPVTTISYQLPETEKVTLKVYDILGQEVKTLINEEQKSGLYEVKLDASALSSGIYFYKLQAGNFISTKKMILLK